MLVRAKKIKCDDLHDQRDDGCLHRRSREQRVVNWNTCAQRDRGRHRKEDNDDVKRQQKANGFSAQNDPGAADDGKENQVESAKHDKSRDACEGHQLFWSHWLFTPILFDL